MPRVGRNAESIDGLPALAADHPAPGSAAFRRAAGVSGRAGG